MVWSSTNVDTVVFRLIGPLSCQADVVQVLWIVIARGRKDVSLYSNPCWGVVLGVVIGKVHVSLRKLDSAKCFRRSSWRVSSNVLEYTSSRMSNSQIRTHPD